MQFIKHQILDLENVAYTAVPSNPLNAEEILNAFRLIRKCAELQGVSQSSKYLIEFSPSKDASQIGISSVTLSSRAPPERLKLQNQFHIENAIKTRFEGSLEELHKSVSSLGEYLKQYRMTAITPIYCAVRTKLETPDDARNTIIDIYVGIDKNVPLA